MSDNYFVKYGLTVMSAGDVKKLLRGQVEAGTGLCPRIAV